MTVNESKTPVLKLSMGTESGEGEKERESRFT